MCPLFHQIFATINVSKKKGYFYILFLTKVITQNKMTIQLKKIQIVYLPHSILPDKYVKT